VERRHWSKAEVKAMAALAQRPQGKLQKEVLVEGPKMIAEALACGWVPSALVLDSKLKVLPEAEVQIVLHSLLPYQNQSGWASTSDLERISRLNTPPSMLGFFGPGEAIKPWNETSLSPWWLVLDRLQDPGNLGTLLRIADWYGFRGLVCSPDSVDCYNSKVIQASMGSIFRIPVHYTPLTVENLSKITGIPHDSFGPELSTTTAEELGSSGPWIIGADLRGKPMDKEAFPPQGGLLLIGNESKGLGSEAKALCRYLWGIPSFGHAESLNAAVAAAVCCHSIRLQGMKP
jgi:TrmH family RNA methyltransferase